MDILAYGYWSPLKQCFFKSESDSLAILQVAVYREPTLTIPGIPAIVQHEILNNRRHVLTKVYDALTLHFSASPSLQKDPLDMKPYEARILHYYL